jgi:uncharacterized protein (DUF58 family)
MDTQTGQAQMTSLLDNQTLGRLGMLRIQTSRRFTNKQRGEHLTGRGGTSTEFSDFRNYVAGDDVRFVDWNIFARLNRPYIKLFELEEEMHVAILVDGSESMLSEGKFERAKQLATALAVMGLMGGERVSVATFGEAGIDRLPPCTGRASMMKLFAFLERAEGGGAAPLERGIEAFLRRHMGKGMVFLLSDFLTFGDVKRSFNRLWSAGLEVHGIQILGPAEMDPEVAGDIRLVDCETGGTLDVSAAADLLGIYHEHREAFARELATLCRQRAGRFVSISAGDALEWVLFDLLQRRGWVA